MKNFLIIFFLHFSFFGISQNDDVLASNVSAATLKNTDTKIHLVASDPEFDTLTYSIRSEPSNGTATLSGDTVTYTPNTDFVGTDTFSFKASDVDAGDSSEIKTVTIKVFKNYLSLATQIGKDINGEGYNNQSGYSVSFNEDATIMAIGANNSYGSGSNSGHVRVFQFSNYSWSQLGENINGEAADDQSGRSVSLSSDGKTVAVGAIANDGNGSNSGHVRIYNYNGTTWSQLGEDINGEAAGDYSGWSVSLSSDGNTVAIGANQNDSNGSDSGHVRVYNFTNGTTWTQLGSDIEGEDGNDQSGYSVSLSSDGKTVAVGAIENDGNGNSSGQVRIYNYNGTAWSQLGEDINGEAAGDYSGWSVSLSSDGNTVAIGANQNDSNGSDSGHVRVYNYDGTSWSQLGEDIDGEASNDHFGFSVSLSSSGKTLAVGGYYNDGNGSDSGHVRIYNYNENVWSQLGSDIDGEAANDYSGSSVSLSSDGTTLAIGAYGNDGYSTNSGHVRVYSLVKTNNVPVASNVSAATVKNSNAKIHLVAIDKDYEALTYSIVSEPSNGTVSLSGNKVIYTPNTDYTGTDSFTYKASDSGDDSEIKTVSIKIINIYSSSAMKTAEINGEAANDESGYSVSFNEDATIMAIGARYADGNYGYNSGHVRVFQFSNDSWSQLGKDIDGEAANDYFGRSVSLSSDGTTLAIGSSDNDGYRTNSGHVRIYQFSNDSWSQLGADIDGKFNNDRLGQSVSLSSDGNTVAIGAYGNDSNGSDSGHVKVYNYNGTWTQLGSDIEGESASDYSGYSVSLSSDGNTVAIGAYKNDGNGSDSGHVRVFNYNGTSWSQLGSDIDGEAAGDESGYSVSLSSDGNTVAIGAYNNDGSGNQSGQVRIYNYNGTAWSQLGSDIDGEAANDQSGYSVSLSSDGNTVAIGALYNDGNGNSSGHVRIYNYNENVWSQLGSDIDGEAANDDSGYSVSLSSDGTTLAIGAPYNDDSGLRSGHVRIYSLTKINKVPVTSDVSAATVENSDAKIHLVASDVNFDDLTYSIVSEPANGTVSLSGNTVTYTPNTNFKGTDTFTYKASDGEADSQTKTVTIKVIKKYLNSANQIGSNINLGTGSNAGQSVSFNEDATIMAIGIPNYRTYSGSVKIYQYSSNAWSQLGADINGEANYDYSGSFVSLSSDGKTIAIGAPYNDGNGNDSGHVRIYNYDGSNWTQLGFDIDGEAANEYSGRSVSLSSDGSTLAVGADYNDGNGTNSGHVRVYSYYAGSWNKRGLDIDGEAASDQSGKSVSLSADGTILAIGAHYNDGNGSNSGHVRVFQFSNDSWSQLGEDIDGEAVSNYSGYSVSLSSDGKTVAIGAIYNNGNGSTSGHVRIYNYNETNWTQLGADINGEAANDESGYSVSLSSDGTTVAIGARGNDDNGSNSGHVRIYNYNETAWSQLGSDIDGVEDNGYAGSSVFLSSDGTNIVFQAQSGLVKAYDLVKLFNSSPVASNVSGATVKNTDAMIHLVASDLDFDALSYSIVSEPSNGTVVIDGDKVTYTPTTDFSGTDTFTFKANDGSNDSEIKTVTVKVIEEYLSKPKKEGVFYGESANDYSGSSVSFNEDATIMAIGAYRNGDNGQYSGHVRVYQLLNDSWTQLGLDISGETAYDYSGRSVSLSSDGKTLAIGATDNDGNGNSSGQVRIYNYNGTAWSQLGSDIDGEAANDQSGYSVSLSSDGNTVAIGALYNDGNGNDSGQVRVFNYNGTDWMQLGSDLDGEAAYDYSGYSVSLSSDGTTLAISARANNGNGSDSGHVRIYKFSGITWTKLGSDIEGEAANDYLGSSVSLSSDGKIVAIGAILNDGNGNDSGHVRVYNYDGTSWSQLGEDIDGEASNDHFGFSVSLSSSGKTLAVGGYYNDGNGSDSGHVRIYNYNENVWSQLGSDIDGEAANDYSGSSVSLSSDGTTLAIGAYGNDGNGTDSGHVRIYSLIKINKIPVASDVSAATIQNTNAKINLVASDVNFDDLTFSIVSEPANGTVSLSGNTVTYTPNTNFKGTDTFTYKANDGEADSQIKTVTIKVIKKYINSATQIGVDIDGEAAGDQSGYSVSFNEDATIMAIGAKTNDGMGGDSGHVRVYQFSSDSWSQLGSDIDGEASTNYSGHSVSLSSDGKTVAIGAPYNSDNGTHSGHVRVYQLKNDSWTQLGLDINGEASYNYSGQSISLSSDGTTLAIGSPYNDDNGSNSGHVRVYNYYLGFWIQLGSDINGEVSSDYSGWSVSLSSDGTTLAVGAPYNDGNESDSGHVRIYNYNGTSWSQLGEDIDGEAANDQSGYSVSLSSDGTTLAIGANKNDGNGNDSGHVRIYNYDGTAWSQLGFDIDGEAANDQSGYSVSLSSDGNIVASGGYNNDGNGTDSGHVRVYSYDGTTWSQLSSDIDGEIGDDQSGHSVSLSSDGTTLAIGAIFNDGNGNQSGHVRVYNLIKLTNNLPIASNVSAATLQNNDANIHLVASDLDFDDLTYSIVSEPSNGTASLSGDTVTYTPNTNFTGTDTFTYKANDGEVDSQTKTVTIKVIKKHLSRATQIGGDINGEAAGDESGYSVSFNEDATIMAIGGQGNDGNGSNSGHVRVYQLLNNSWTQLGLDIDGEAAGDKSGWSVSLSSDGKTVAIGADGNDVNGNASGHVRVYNYNGTAWSQLGSDIDGETENDKSGYSVSLSSDGNTVAIGAYKNDGNGSDSGHVRVYNYNGTSWSQLGSDIDGEAAGDESGYSVSLSSDGKTVAVGAIANDGNGNASGHVRVYNYNGTAWSQLGADIDGEAANDDSGRSVSLSSDGKIVAVGAIANDGNGNASGHVRVYNYNGTSWSQLGSDIDGEAAGDESGYSVSLSSDGTTLAIGSYENDDNGVNSGHVRIYNYNGSAWTQLGSDIDGEAAGDQFGRSLFLSSDGTTLAVGAILNDGSAANSGHVRVYNLVRFINSVPTASNISAATVKNTDAKIHLVASDLDFDALSYSIVSEPSYGSATLSGDTVTYTPNTDSKKTDTFTYKANDGEVDSKTKTVTIKVVQGYLSTATQIGDDIDGEAAGDESGYSVSFNEDATIMAIGGQGNDGNGSNSGHVRVYQFSNDSWSQLGSDINGEATNDYSGSSVSLSSDGKTVAIGALYNDGNESDSGHVRVYNYNGSNWSQLGSDIDGEATNEYSGRSVSLSSDGSTLAVGAYLNNVNGNASGQVRVYNYNGSAWTQLGSDLDGEAASDQSGHSVSLSSDGTTLAIGAIANDGNGVNSGHVRIYNYNGTAWSQLGSDIDGEAAGDYSGWSVSLSSDGKTVAIGANQNDSNGNASGHVRVYNYNGSAWTQLGSDIDGEKAGDQSGHSVSLSSDGTTLAIGSYENDDNGVNSGHVRIYNYNGSAWTQLGSDIDGEAAGDQFGRSLFLSSDGTTLAVGAILNDGSAANSGHVRVYNIIYKNKKPIAVADTNSVEEDSSLTSINVIANDSDEDGDELSLIAATTSGSGSVSVNDDALSIDYTPQINFNGTEVITYTVSDGSDSVNGILTVTVNPVNDPVIASNVSASTLKNTSTKIHLVASDIDFDDLTYTIVSNPVTGTLNLSGDIVTYTPATDVSGTVTFTYKASDGTLDSETKTVTLKIIDEYLSSSNQIGSDIDGEQIDDFSGKSVAFSEDASIMAVGAYSNDGNGNDSGHVRVYQFSDDSWSQLGEDIDGEAGGDRSGYSVSLSSDGKILAVGATGNEGNGSNSGHVRIYNYDGTNWSQLGEDIDGKSASYNSGSSVSLSSDGKTIAIGSNESDQNGENSGLVKIYNYNGSAWTQLGSDIDGEAAGDASGFSVSISSNGSIVAVGAPLNNDNGVDSGHVKVYQFNGLSWLQLGANINGESDSDQLGFSVSLSSNGKILAVGANKNNANGADSGHVKVYKYSSDSWQQLGSDIIGEASADFSGNAVSLSSNGKTLSVGGEYNDGNGINSGHVRVFNLNGNNWSQIGSDIDGEESDDQSGHSVSLSSDGTKLAVGAYKNDGNGSNSGHVRVYDLANLKSINLDNDRDGDTILDEDDNCPDVSNTDQSDIDGDGIGDVCDEDRDGDGIINTEDNCPDVSNVNQEDMDSDGIGDVCDDDRDGDSVINTEDNCPDVSNADQGDIDDDGIGDVCDDDRDGDGVINSEDNCPDVSNANQEDMDSDGIGDVCDDDRDGDGVINTEDNCPDVSNTDQSDIDGDGIGDVCDDSDGDGIFDDVDNCLDVSNTDQSDTDGDGIGDVCDDDIDGDGVINTEDNCPDVSNANQEDMDSDGIGDVCDNDIDGDSILNETDNCPLTINADQSDQDKDGVGDVCDPYFNLPANNNKVAINRATCIGYSNGSIELSIEDNSYNYTITVSGKSDPIYINGESKTASVTGLSKGTYTVCFKVDGQESYEQCFEVVIGEPKTLNAFIDIDNDKRTTTIQLTGSKNYYVEINGVKNQVKSDRFTTILPTGLSIVKIYTDLDCQGLIEREIFISEDIHYYPNPTDKDVSVHVYGEDTVVQVSVFSEKGDLIYTREQQIQDFSRKTNIDLSRQITGTYIVVMDGPTVRKTFKIVKK